MATATNIIIFTIFLSFFIYIFASLAPNPSGITSVAQGITTWNQSIGITDTLKIELNTFTVSGALGIAAIFGTFMFPNPYTIFLPIFVLLLGFYSIIYSQLDLIKNAYGADPTIILLMQVGMGVLYLLSLVGWYKGGDSP